MFKSSQEHPGQCGSVGGASSHVPEVRSAISNQAHAWVAGSIPSQDTDGRQPIHVSLLLSLSSSLSKINNHIYFFKAVKSLLDPT